MENKLFLRYIIEDNEILHVNSNDVNQKENVKEISYVNR